jgi:RND family efflux transporter MFP subunit
MHANAQAWLGRHCEGIPGVTRAVVVQRTGGGDAFVVAAHWPREKSAGSDLAASAGQAARRGEATRRSEPPSSEAPLGTSRIAVPFALPSGSSGAVALEIGDAKAAESEDLVRQLAEAARRLEEPPPPAQGRVPAVLGLVGSALGRTRFRDAATAVATELATLLRCERVSIGFAPRGHTSVEALSHSAAFDSRSALVRQIAEAMDEARDQDLTLIHPAPHGSAAQILRAHGQLAEEHGAGRICTVPIAAQGRLAGAITFEWSGRAEPDANVLELAEGATALVGPILELQRQSDARVGERVMEFLRTQADNLRGPGHLHVKLALGAALFLFLLLALSNGTHRVTADATLEGRVQRAIVAGLEGYIAEADARAGDLVRKGQILGRLDERDLSLERSKWQSRHEQLRREYREALAEHDRTRLNILSAKLGQARAQVELLDENLARTRLVAPFDGVIVSGDLSQSLGSPVEKGAVLFQIAPLDGYRIILKVDERAIVGLDVGQPGRLALSARPGAALPFTVERITPVSVAEDGRNYFRVEARLEEPADWLRPGMEGVAKIDAGPRTRLWIWTHGFVDWLRLTLWSWWP